MATKAAAICIGKTGACDSIPVVDEVMEDLRLCFSLKHIYNL